MRVLGLFLAIGESFSGFRKQGQENLIKTQLLKNYSAAFDQVYVFSYKDEKLSLYGNVSILPNKWKLHRYLYALLCPLLYTSYIKRCSVLRGLQLSGGIPALASKLAFRKKFVINYGYDYASYALTEGKRLQFWLYRIMIRPLLIAADKVVTTTEVLSDQIAHIVPETKIELIPNSVDTRLFQPKRLRKRHILFIGRLEPQKNPILLIEAVAQLRSRRPLLIIGDGSLKPRIIELAKKYRLEMTILPRVSHQYLPKYLNESYCLVLPSILEGHPKVLLEAMSCAVPVIGTDVEGIRNLIENRKNGLLVEPNVQAMTKAISQVLENWKLQAKLGKNARLTALANYSSAEIMDKEIRLLKSLI